MAARSAALWAFRRSVKIAPTSTPSAAQPMTSVIRQAPIMVKLPERFAAKRPMSVFSFISESSVGNDRRSGDRLRQRRYERKREDEAGRGVVIDPHDIGVRIQAGWRGNDIDLRWIKKRIIGDARRHVG